MYAVVVRGSLIAICIYDDCNYILSDFEGLMPPLSFKKFTRSSSTFPWFVTSLTSLSWVKIKW